MLEELEAEFRRHPPDDGMIFSHPLAAVIDPAFSLAAGFLREHSPADSVPGLQDLHRCGLVQFQDAPCGHEPGEPTANNDDISHVRPQCSRSFSRPLYMPIPDPEQ
jgi:hypothetical protein